MDNSSLAPVFELCHCKPNSQMCLPCIERGCSPCQIQWLLCSSCSATDCRIFSCACPSALPTSDRSTKALHLLLLQQCFHWWQCMMAPLEMQVRAIWAAGSCRSSNRLRSISLSRIFQCKKFVDAHPIHNKVIDIPEQLCHQEQRHLQPQLQDGDIAKIQKQLCETDCAKPVLQNTLK